MLDPRSYKAIPHNIKSTSRTFSCTDSETLGDTEEGDTEECSDDQNSGDLNSSKGICNDDVSIFRSFYCCIKNKKKKNIERLDSTTSSNTTMAEDVLDVFDDDSESV